MTEVLTRIVVANEEDLNRDPISGAPGAHPLGTGAGAASGGVAGAAVGMSLGGPIGGVIGAAMGAVAGGVGGAAFGLPLAGLWAWVCAAPWGGGGGGGAGSSAAESVNPTSEEMFWRETYVREPYYVKGMAYEYYAPAFRAGWEGRVRNDGRSFAEAEPDLKAGYNLTKSELDPDWQEIRPAACAAWDRVDRNWKARP